MKLPFFRHSVFLLGVVALSACASPAEMQSMVVVRPPVASVAPSSPFRNTLTIARVEGGEETNPLCTSQVDNAAFQGALRASLEQTALLAPSPASSRFELFASLGSLNQPLIGLDLTVLSNVNYRVVERRTGQVWFQDTVVGSYTATFGDSPLAIQRLRLANEGSIRENIQGFTGRVAGTRPPAGFKPATTSLEEKLRDLKKLLDDGLINQDEHDRKKRQILNTL